MTCHDSKRLLPGLVLDEIDVEERREVEKHLEACAECRAERDTLARVQAQMKSLPEVETSQARRDAAVKAMAGARSGILEQAMVAPRRGWLGWAAAAAILVAASSYLLFDVLFAGPSFKVVSGTAVIVRPGGTETAAAGASIGRGDRLIAKEPVRLENSGIVIDITGTLALQPGELLLESGSMRVDVRRGELVITDISRDRLVLKAGRFSVDAFEVKGGVGSPIKTEVRPSLRGIVREGSAVLEGENGRVVLNTGEMGWIDPRGYPDRRKE